MFWTSGLIEEILDLVHNDNEAENSKVDKFYRLSAMTSIFSLTRVVEFRVPLRDKGILDIILKAYDAANPEGLVSVDWDEKVSDMLMNMAERDEIKISLKNSDALRLLCLFISNHPEPEDASRLFSLIALAHIWGADVDFGAIATGQVKLKSQETVKRVESIAHTIQAEGFSATKKKLLEESGTLLESDPSTSALSADEKKSRMRDDLMKAESLTAGRLLKENNLNQWLFQKLIQSLDEGTATIKAAGFTIFLNVEDMIHAIQSISSNKGAAKNMGEKSEGLFVALVRMLKGDRARDPEDNNREVLIMTLTSILNFTDVKEIRNQIEEDGERKEIEDAVIELQEKMKDDQEIQDLAKGVVTNLEGKARNAEVTAAAVMKKVNEGQGDESLFDVFLSHKRTE